MSAAVIIPTYNELANLPLIINDILALRAGVQIIVVDDNSPDGTGRVLDELAARHSDIHPLHRPRKMGLGTAHVAGMRIALEHNWDPILSMDADFSHHPRFIPSLIEATSRLDVVIGSRYVAGGGTLGCSLHRRVLSRQANLFARSMLGLYASDCTAGFRAYRSNVLRSIDLDAIFANGYSFLIEMLYRCQEQGWQIGEVPIIFEDRMRGTSKISRQEILKAMKTVVRLRQESGLLPYHAPLVQTKKV